MLSSAQEVPATVASEQLNAALSAGLQEPANAVGSPGGVSLPLVLFLAGILLVLLFLARYRSRRRKGSPTPGGPEPSHRAAGDGGAGGVSAPRTPPQPQGIALPPHLAAALARRAAERAASKTPTPSDDDGVGETTPEARSGPVGGLDILIGS